MINYKILEALEKVDDLIKQELKEFSFTHTNRKERLQNARELVQEAITEILKG